MKALVSMLLAAACLSAIACAGKASGPELVSGADGRFIVVLHEDVDPGIAAPMLKLLAANSDRIKADLGVSDSTAYTVHVRATEEEYLSVMRSLTGNSYPGSTGYVAGRFRAELLVNPAVVQDALHEYAHSVSLFIEPRWYNKPRWLWEALAAYESGEFHDPKTVMNTRLGIFPSIAELDEDFGHSDQIYQVGYVLFEFLKEGWGMEVVKELIRRRGDIPAVLGVSVEEFERSWDEWTTAKYL